METLQQFIKSNPPARDLKRSLAVQMSQQGHRYRTIRDVLGVSLGFIAQAKQRYEREGVEGLKSNYWGTQGYLSAQQKQTLFQWLGQRDDWTLEEVIEQIAVEYEVVYQSQQSYYALLQQAGLSWKKSQPTHPGKDEEQVQEKKTKLWRYCSSGVPRLPVGKSG